MRDVWAFFQLHHRPPLAKHCAPAVSPCLQMMILAGLSILFRLLFWRDHGVLVLPDALGRYLPIAEGLFTQWRGTIYDTPGYPVFLALIFKILGTAPFPFVQHLLDTGTVLLCFNLARRLGFRRGAFLLGCYMALHPASALFANAVLAETLFCFLLLSAVTAYLRYGGDRLRWAALMGLFLGLATITRANGQLALLVGLVLVALSGRQTRGLAAAALYVLAALLPVGGWLLFQHQHRGIWTLSQGAGWQLMQNAAWFELLDPKLLPEGVRADYSGWESLSQIRTAYQRGRISPPLSETELDAMFGSVARQSLRQRPLGWVKALPGALLLPRRFIADETRAATHAAQWEVRRKHATDHGYGSWMKPLPEPNMFRHTYRLLRAIWLFYGKYTLLLLLCVPAAIWSWRRRNAAACLLLALPLSQALVLLLMLNPIERYYFPFEPLMILGILLSWRGSKSAPEAR